MTQDSDIFTVSEVSRHIRNVIESNIPNLFVEGEIANFTKHNSGHIYFSLKDAKSSLRCVFFKTYALYLNFSPKDGDKVICGGKITVYEKSGNYQLSVTRMIQSGIGDLQRKFEELKNKLDEEGLFDSEYKKPIPEYPESIGVITSATGAAIQDIKNVLNRRFPVDIYLYPAVVQGDIAPKYLMNGIKYFNEEFPVDVLIIGRGGGSQEDLFCFNDEELARTIFASRIPIISAVGHEIDFTISDFVADLRAPTPSAAAELAVPDRNEILGQIEGYRSTMQYAIKQFLFSKKMEISELESNLLEHHPRSILQRMKQQLESAVLNLTHFSQINIKYFQNKLEILKNELRELSPQEALKRGYAFILKERKLLNSVKDVVINEELDVMLSDGKLKAEVIEIEENEKLSF